MFQYINISSYRHIDILVNKKSMSKIIPSQLSKKDINKLLELLHTKMTNLKTKQQIANFISDLLTESEQIMILRRLQIAKLLLDGLTYYEIRSKLGVGIDTIRNVRHKLESGHGGYINFIRKL